MTSNMKRPSERLNGENSEVSRFFNQIEHILEMFVIIVTNYSGGFSGVRNSGN